MNHLINVYIDIYENRFSNDLKQAYVYNNIRAINPDEQPLVEEALSIMRENNSPLLLPNSRIFNRYQPIETSRECILNRETLCFEFE